MKRFFTKRSDHVAVKICGLKNEIDALAAIESGADALGFNLYPGSKRYLDWEKEAAWIRELPEEVSRLAVVVNTRLEEATRLLEEKLVRDPRDVEPTVPEACARIVARAMAKSPDQRYSTCAEMLAR